MGGCAGACRSAWADTSTASSDLDQFVWTRAFRPAWGVPQLALDAYAWLTYRVLKLGRETVVPWWSLEVQFRANYRQRW